MDFSHSRAQKKRSRGPMKPGEHPTHGTVRQASAARALLGEGPVWVAHENAVYWVDIKGKALHRLSLADASHTHWPMPQMLGWVVPRCDHRGFIAGFKSGFARLWLDPVRVEPICAPEADLPDSRMNDAGVDRAGRIWAGTMDDREQAPTGCLYRLDAAGRCTRHDTGYVVSNGPTFSPEHDLLYHTDTTRRAIYRFALGADGTLGARETFVVFPDDWGSPDGMATDRGWNLGGPLGRPSLEPVFAGWTARSRHRDAGLERDELLLCRSHARADVRHHGVGRVRRRAVGGLSFRSGTGRPRCAHIPLCRLSTRTSPHAVKAYRPAPGTRAFRLSVANRCRSA